MKRSDKVILAETKQWIKAINKHFKIRKKIIIKISHSKDKELYYATTNEWMDKNKPFILTIYPDNFQNNELLFVKVYHELVHILLFPLIGETKSKRIRDIEESIVMKLESLVNRLVRRMDEKV